MRIRRRDRGETPVAEPPPPVEPESLVTPLDPAPIGDESPTRPPAVTAEPVPVSPAAPAAVVESPPPFDQALLLPVPAPPTADPPPALPSQPPPPVAAAPAVSPPPLPTGHAAAPPNGTSEVQTVEQLPDSISAPAPTRAAAPAVQMRTPTIRAEANGLLDGARPSPRELPRVIAIANQKGGVGKTTTTVNLGAALAEIGYRVLVIDLDPQGNATTGLGIDARNFELSMYDVIMRDQSLEDCIEPTSVKNLFVAPATIDLAGIEIELVPAFSREMKLKKAIDTVVDDFDFILIDCPPSLGLITVNGLAAAGEVMVPIQCEYYALEGLSQLLRNVNLVSSNLNESLEVTTIVLTMFDARTRLSIEVANEVRLHFADRVCKSVIPRTVRLSEAPSFGQPITVFDPTSRGAVAYRELAKEVSNGAPQRTR
jgi:chromosome partitioning protein